MRSSLEGLRLLIAPQLPGELYVCTDYGFREPPSSVAAVSTGHLLIHRSGPTANTDGVLNVQVSALNPTALVMLRNHGGAHIQCDGRGSGSAGPTGPLHDKTVVWSPACSAEGGAWLWADSAPAQTLLQASGYRPLKNAEDDGCCEVLTHGESGGTGTEEFRWALA